VSRVALPTRERLARLIRAFPGRPIAVVGDFVADEFVHGEIARVSREAPVLILEQRAIEVVPGGAGNAVANLRALGAVPVPVGIVGRDASGRRLVEQMKRAGVPTAGLRVEPGWETPTKSRILAGGIHTRRQQVVRLDRGSPHGDLAPAVLSRLHARLRKAVRGVEGILVADYGYGAAPPGVLDALGARARRLPIAVDSRTRVERFRRVAACTPNHNQEEVERALGLANLRSDAAVLRGGKALLKRTRNQAVLVTRGAKGMVLFEPDAAPLALPAFGSDEVADVTGAGDTVIAVFALTLLAGGTFLEAAVLANVAAGLVVMKFGTATTRRREMLDALASAVPR
jgi:rfaE bifunctional protein kinase chain/domain